MFKWLRYSVWLGCAVIAHPANAINIQFVDRTATSGLTTGIYGGFGSAWADFNGDGWQDVWIVNHMYQPGLYLNKRDGTFENITASAWSGNPLLDAHGAAWADFDNDGDPDLAQLAGVNGVWERDKPFYVNHGGTLADEGASKGLNDRAARGRTPTWLDWDNDGRLDLYMANYPRLGDDLSQRRLMLNKPAGFVDAAGMKKPIKGFFSQLAHFDGATHLLVQGGPYPIAVHRLGNPNPVPVSFSSKLADVADVGIADFDGDLSDDLFVLRTRSATNSYELDPLKRDLKMRLASPGTAPGVTYVIAGPKKLTLRIYESWKPEQVHVGASGKLISRYVSEKFNNRTWKFVETTLDSTDASVNGIMKDTSQKAPGVYVGRTPAGTWQIRVRNGGEFRAVVHAEDADMTSVTATGTTFSTLDMNPALYFRRGTVFKDEAAARGLGKALSCDSIAVGDFDNDMDVDAYLACTTAVGNKDNILLENTGSGFVEVANAGGGKTASIGTGGAVSAVDYNNDGYLDLLVTDGKESSGYPFHYGRRYLLQNQGGTNHWIKFKLVGCQSNRDAVGARVTVTAGGRQQAKLQAGGMHNGVQDDTRVHFGLASNEVAQAVVVKWPSGKTSTLANLEADRIHTLQEDASCTRP
jgi:ASPIC and UnbV/FG-GAP-like repeat